MARPGCRRPASDICLEGFPEGDGLWWVRWFDHEHVLPGGTNSPTIRVSLSSLPLQSVGDPQLPALDEVLAASDGPNCVVRMQAGWLPMLHVGAVVQAGRIVGELGGKVRSFLFSARTHAEAIQDLSPPEPDMPPSHRALRGLGPPPKRLRSASFAIPGQPRGRMLVLGARRGYGSGGDLAIPCPEVFRIMYAPHRMLALALLSGPWSAQAGDVLDTENTFVSQADENVPAWQVATMPGFGPPHLAVAGNLFLGQRGRRAAADVWTWLSGRGPDAGISAAIPFDWESLRLEVACVWIAGAPWSPGFWLGYRILRVGWPPHPLGSPPRMDWLPPPPPPRANPDAVPEDRSAAGGSTPTPNPLAKVLSGSGSVDPGEGGATVEIGGAGAAWTDEPEVRRVEYAPRPPSDGPRRRRRPRELTDVVSGGAGASGSGRPALASVDARDLFGGGGLPCRRFEEVVDVLDALVVQRRIDAHAQVEAPPASAAWRELRAVWALPAMKSLSDRGAERWYLRDVARAGRRPVRRTAMLRSIGVAGRTAYWIELEPRGPGDRLRSLVFATGGRDMERKAISALLEHAALRRGVWDPCPALMAAVPLGGGLILAASDCRHVYGPPAEGSLERRLLADGPHRAIMDVLGR